MHGWEVAPPGLATRSGEVKGADYIQFYVMGSLVREGRGAALYDTNATRVAARHLISPRLEFHPARNPYGPQVALAFEPLARLPYLTSLAVFSLLSLSAYAAAVWLLWRHAPGLAGAGGYVALVAAASPALLVTLRFGQISTLTLLAPAFAVVALTAGRRLVAGLCLGLLAYKPQLLVVALPVLLLARDWRCLAGLLAATAGQLGLAWTVVGTDVMQQYVQTLTQLLAHPDVVMLHPENSHSIRGLLRLAGVSPTVATAAGVTLVLACTPALARVWRANEPPLMRVSLLVLVTLLLTPHLLTYDLLLLVVPIIALADQATMPPEDRAVRLAIVVAVALYAAPFSPVIAALTHVQLSTVAMAAGVWITARAMRASVAEEELR
jgi:alpha-1,2-mannosyltransferase